MNDGGVSNAKLFCNATPAVIFRVLSSISSNCNAIMTNSFSSAGAGLPDSGALKNERPLLPLTLED